MMNPGLALEEDFVTEIPQCFGTFSLTSNCSSGKKVLRGYEFSCVRSPFDGLLSCVEQTSSDFFERFHVVLRISPLMFSPSVLKWRIQTSERTTFYPFSLFVSFVYLLFQSLRSHCKRDKMD